MMDIFFFTGEIEATSSSHASPWQPRVPCHEKHEDVTRPAPVEVSDKLASMIISEESTADMADKMIQEKTDTGVQGTWRHLLSSILFLTLLTLHSFTYYLYFQPSCLQVYVVQQQLQIYLATR